MYYNQNPFMGQRPSFKTRFMNFVKDKSVLNRLIVINVVIYLCVLLLGWICSIVAFLMNYNADNQHKEKYCNGYPQRSQHPEPAPVNNSTKF